MSRTEVFALAAIIVFIFVAGIYNAVKMYYWMDRRPPNGKDFSDDA
jgi:hypothetical protein